MKWENLRENYKEKPAEQQNFIKPLKYSSEVENFRKGPILWNTKTYYMPTIKYEARTRWRDQETKQSTA